MPTSAWSTTAADNGSALGIDIAENCDAANINNAIREAMAQLKLKLDAMDALIAGGASFQPLDTDLTAIAALTSAANKFPYATGAGTWALATVSSAARDLLDDGDAATMRTTLGALGATVTTDTDGTAIAIVISGTTYYLQYGTKSIGGNTTAVVTFPEAFAAAPTVVGGGGHSGTSDADQIRVVSSTVTVNGFTLVNSDAATLTGHWLATGA